MERVGPHQGQHGPERTALFVKLCRLRAQAATLPEHHLEDLRSSLAQESVGQSRPDGFATFRTTEESRTMGLPSGCTTAAVTLMPSPCGMQ